MAGEVVLFICKLGGTCQAEEVACENACSQIHLSQHTELYNLYLHTS